MRFNWNCALYLLIMNFFEDVTSKNCAGTIELNATTSLQFITTPNYEINATYPPFLDCNFLIKAPDKSRIMIEIVHMEMEPRLFTTCGDYVAIYDGTVESNNTLIGQFCENIVGRQIISDNNSVLIQFRSDDLYEYRGANISYNYLESKTCPPSWIEYNDTSSDQTFCVKLMERSANWIVAQNRCIEQRSNLVLIGTNDKFNFLLDSFKSFTQKTWVGYNDAKAEGKLQAINGDDTGPKPVEENFSTVTDNNDENDCLTMEFTNASPFKEDSCVNHHAYLCEQKKNWDTTLYPPSAAKLEEGAYSKSSQYSLWLLLFLIGLLFLTILAFLCFMCWKQKDTPRVHSETAVIQQNAFMNDPPRNIATPVATTNNNIVPVSTSPKPTAHFSPTPIAQTASAPEGIKPIKKFPVSVGPNHVPMSEEHSESERIVETSIMGPSRFNDLEPLSLSALTQPKPQPRTLPPIPTREGTFHSMNTRDESTLRTRRNKDVFDRPVMHVLDNVSAISLDEFWSNKRS